MSQIIVNIPDCASYAEQQKTQATHDNIITVDTSTCPVQPPGPPAFITIGPTIIIGIVVLALIVAVSIVRYRAHEQKPAKLKARNEARQIELDAEVRMAALHKKCTTCGDLYQPELQQN